MAQERYATDDLTTKARIRDAAFELIAERGAGRTSVRSIAERSGVSPGLVTHHYGSKQAVFDEVARWALQLLTVATDEVNAAAVNANTAAEGLDIRQGGIDRLFARFPTLEGYVRQTFLDARPEGIRWFREVVDKMVLDLQQRETAGLARPSADIRTESAMLLVLMIAPVLIRPFLDAALGTDLASDKGRARWSSARAELLTSAVYPPKPARRRARP